MYPRIIETDDDEFIRSAEALCAAATRFHKLPLSEKERVDGYSRREPQYSGSETQCVESFDTRGPCSFAPEETRRYFEAARRFAEDIAKIIQVEELGDPMLRMLYYPPARDCGDNVVGISEHTDFELFSIVYQNCSGLEIWQDDEWIQPQESVVLLVGDALESLTAGFAKATRHRVPRRCSSSRERSSLVFFQPLPDDASLKPVKVDHLVTRASRRIAAGKYPDVTQLQHIFAKDRAAHRRRADLNKR